MRRRAEQSRAEQSRAEESGMRIRAAREAGRRDRGGARAKSAFCRKVQKIGGAVDLREKFFSVKENEIVFCVF